MHVYVLRLQSEKFYVGSSVDVEARVAEHFLGRGALWTQLNPPLEVVSVRPGGLELENATTVAMMIKHGWRNVRGGSWAQLVLKSVPRPIAKAYSKRLPRMAHEETPVWTEASVMMDGHVVRLQQLEGDAHDVVASITGPTGRAAVIAGSAAEAMDKAARSIEGRRAGRICVDDEKSNDAESEGQKGRDA